MSSQPSAPIGQYADCLNVAAVALGAEISYRLGVSIRALMEATSDTTSDISPYIYREPVLTQNLRLTNITVPDIPAAPVAKRAALVMAVLETRRRFLEE